MSTNQEKENEPLKQSSSPGIFECDAVLKSYLHRLSEAVPMDVDTEKIVWNQLEELRTRFRSLLAGFPFVLEKAAGILKQTQTPDALQELFSPSVIQKHGGAIRLLKELPEHCSRFEELAAGLSGKPEQREKLRAEAAEAERKCPLQTELIFEFYDTFRSCRELLEEADPATRENMYGKVFACSHPELAQFRLELEELVASMEGKRNLLVESYLRLVVSIAKKFQGKGVPFADLIQEGNIGLVKSINKFDTRLEHRFSTYATWWIKQSVFHAVGRQALVIRLPLHMLVTLKKISRTEQEILLETGREATTDEIAAKLDMTRERVNSLKHMAMQSISLQAPVLARESSGVSLEETVMDPNPENDPMHTLAKKILNEKLSESLHKLPPRLQEVLTLRYGLDGLPPRSITEMTRHFNVSRERIRQIELKALARLRNPDTIEMLEDYFT